MEIIIILIILLIAALILKNVENLLIFTALLDIFLRIITFIGNNTIDIIKEITTKYIPNSIESIIRSNTDGIIEIILVWIYIILMTYFVFKETKRLLKRAR